MSFREELEAYASVPGLGPGARRGLSLLGTFGSAALRRQGEHAHLTASALVFDADAHHVVLVHHAKLGGWVQPGGHLEEGDASFLAAAQREVSEETGLAPEGAPPAAPARITEHALTGGRCLAHVDVLFGFFVATGSPLAPGSRWFPVDALPTSVLPDLPPVIAQVAGPRL